MMVRRLQAEVGKEAVRHVDVIVLSGMDQCRHAPVLPLQHVVERRNLHEVGPGRGDKVNLLTRHQAQSPRMCLQWLINSQRGQRSEEHTSELQSLMRISYAVFCLKKTKQPNNL